MGRLGSGVWVIDSFDILSCLCSQVLETPSQNSKLVNLSNTEIGPQIRLWALCKSQVSKMKSSIVTT